MKLRITVEGRAYEVEVEVLEGAEAGGREVGPVPTAAAAFSGASSGAGRAVPARPAAAASAGAGEVPSPIAGTVTKVLIKPGDVVKVNDTLLVLEAMKMESNVASPAAGTVASVAVIVGDAVQAGQALLRLG